jgi:hypothetical protein
MPVAEVVADFQETSTPRQHGRRYHNPSKAPSIGIMERKERHSSDKLAGSSQACPGCLLCTGSGSWYARGKNAGTRAPQRSDRLARSRSGLRLWVP